MLDAAPLGATIWDEDINHIDCNQETVNLFGLSSKEEYLSRFDELLPQYQPDGCPSMEKLGTSIRNAFGNGYVQLELMCQKLDGEPLPMEVTLVRIQHGDGFKVLSYKRDLRELRKIVGTLNQFEKLAFTDAVTGIHNRHYFERNAESAFRSSGAGRSLAVMMLDLDHFKNVNDTYGHAAGDEVLHTVALTIQNTLRSSDIVARYGGEEFIVLITDSKREVVATLAERIRKRIAETKITFQEVDIHVTVSIGVAIRDDLGLATMNDLIELADKAMYQAKADGRNQVRV
jgi:diguanylate cyclase (GGDEF)-like protein